jgi:hypothetical protein
LECTAKVIHEYPPKHQVFNQLYKHRPANSVHRMLSEEQMMKKFSKHIHGKIE